MAFDQAGNVYVADTESNSVEKYSPTGVDLGVFVSSNLNVPVGLAFDSAGNLYVSNALSGFDQFSPGYIEEFSPSGADLGVFAVTDEDPGNLAFDGNGNLFVVNANNDTIQKIAPDGTVSEFATGSPFSNIAFDSSGNLYASEYFNNVVEEFDSSGDDLGPFINGGALNGPDGLAFFNGNLYVVNSLSDSVEEYAPDGTDLGMFTSTAPNQPQFIAFGSIPASTSPLQVYADYGVNSGDDTTFTIVNTGSTSITGVTLSGSGYQQATIGLSGTISLPDIRRVEWTSTRLTATGCSLMTSTIPIPAGLHTPWPGKPAVRCRLRFRSVPRRM